MWSWTHRRLQGLKVYFPPLRLETASHSRNLQFCLWITYERICPPALGVTLARNREEKIKTVTLQTKMQNIQPTKLVLWPGSVQWPSVFGILALSITCKRSSLSIDEKIKIEKNSPAIDCTSLSFFFFLSKEEKLDLCPLKPVMWGAMADGRVTKYVSIQQD